MMLYGIIGIIIFGYGVYKIFTTNNTIIEKYSPIWFIILFNVAFVVLYIIPVNDDIQKVFIQEYDKSSTELKVYVYVNNKMRTIDNYSAVSHIYNQRPVTKLYCKQWYNSFGIIVKYEYSVDSTYFDETNLY